jgi:pullulanase/glycogen debranching enzyme
MHVDGFRFDLGSILSEYPRELADLAPQFAGVENEYWKSDLKIVSYDFIREISYRGDGLDLIPRRYCRAKGIFNDGRVRPVTYNIGEELGFSSYGFGVELCVGGLDRENAYAPNCSMARP